jgi:hypothetical protein
VRLVRPAAAAQEIHHVDPPRHAAALVRVHICRLCLRLRRRRQRKARYHRGRRAPARSDGETESSRVSRWRAWRWTPNSRDSLGSGPLATDDYTIRGCLC